jgi:flavorubredoxin
MVLRIPNPEETPMQSDVLAAVPVTEPQEIAPETWLIPNLFPAGDGLFVPVNTMLIRGVEPVIVDTGAPVHRELWLDKVFSLVDPEDVRWVFLSHDDGDHTGGLLDVLERCPNATLVTNFFSVERLALDTMALPLERMRWVDEGGILDAGDRTLQLFKPPIFDGPTTRGLYDPTTGAMWAVDSFACLTPGTLDAHDVPRDLLDESMPAMNSLVSPWHQWLDPAAYRRHVDDVESLGVLTVASAHGPILTGDAIRRSFDVVRRLAGQPIIPAPGQELLDDLVQQVLAA